MGTPYIIEYSGAWDFFLMDGLGKYLRTEVLENVEKVDAYLPGK